MNDPAQNPSELAGSEVTSPETRLEWETPELIVENIQQVTRGGPYHAAHPVTDDIYYS